jgi:RNA polymerase sigma-70 factor (ECF subfamily)
MMPTRVNELSDEQLMTGLDGPEVEAALPELYDRYSHTVFGVGLKILGDRSMAEELVQEVFLKVWRSSNTFDPTRGSFSTWLYRVTRSGALDLYRKRGRRVRPVSDGDPYLGSARDPSAGPQEIVDESWLPWAGVQSARGARRATQGGDRPGLFRGLSQREISLRTGIPRGTVKSRTARAFERLRTELAPGDTLREKAR